MDPANPMHVQRKPEARVAESKDEEGSDFLEANRVLNYARASTRFHQNVHCLGVYLALGRICIFKNRRRRR